MDKVTKQIPLSGETEFSQRINMSHVKRKMPYAKSKDPYQPVQPIAIHCYSTESVGFTNSEDCSLPTCVADLSLLCSHMAYCSFSPNVAQLENSKDKNIDF